MKLSDAEIEAKRRREDPAYYGLMEAIENLHKTCDKLNKTYDRIIKKD